MEETTKTKVVLDSDNWQDSPSLVQARKYAAWLLGDAYHADNIIANLFRPDETDEIMKRLYNYDGELDAQFPYCAEPANRSAENE